MSEVTQILEGLKHGDRQAANQLLPAVYNELRQLAAKKLAHEPPGQTLEATALVHEAYLRLIGEDDQPCWKNRAHFFSAAAEAMRRILVDNARRKHALKRGSELERIELEGVQITVRIPPEELIVLNDALEKLAEEAPKKAALVKLRYFTGLTLEESAKALGISRATASNYWAYARAWLHSVINDKECISSNEKKRSTL